MPINPVMPDNVEIEAEQHVEGDRHDDSQPQQEAPPSRQEPPARQEPARREPPPAEDDEDDFDPAKEATRPEAEAASEAGKELAARKRGLEGRKQTIQESINALVRERSEVSRETERGRQERADLQREIESLRGQRERLARGEPEQDPRREGDPRARTPQADPGFDPRDPRPVEGNFQDFAEFAEAVGRWGARQEVRAAERQRGQREEQGARQRWEQDRQQKYSTRYQAFAASNPTFEQEINREDLLLTAPMVDTIKDSDVGPEILLYLARNSREIDRLTAMHPVLAYGEMKKIEARLEGAHSGSPQPVAQHSKAPAPIKPVANASSRRSDSDDIPDADVSDDEHFERMNKRDEMLRKRGVNTRKGYGLRI